MRPSHGSPRRTSDPPGQRLRSQPIPVVARVEVVRVGRQGREVMHVGAVAVWWRRNPEVEIGRVAVTCGAAAGLPSVGRQLEGVDQGGLSVVC